jgi:hypothetical protein
MFWGRELLCNHYNGGVVGAYQQDAGRNMTGSFRVATSVGGGPSVGSPTGIFTSSKNGATVTDALYSSFVSSQLNIFTLNIGNANEFRVANTAVFFTITY